MKRLIDWCWMDRKSVRWFSPPKHTHVFYTRTNTCFPHTHISSSAHTASSSPAREHEEGGHEEAAVHPHDGVGPLPLGCHGVHQGVRHVLRAPHDGLPGALGPRLDLREVVAAVLLLSWWRFVLVMVGGVEAVCCNVAGRGARVCLCVMKCTVAAPCRCFLGG